LALMGMVSIGFSASAHGDSLCLNDLSSLSFTRFLC